MPDRAFWKGKRVLVTGHTGFKGSWLSLWLSSMGAELFGYSAGKLPAPSLYELAGIDRLVPSATGDIRNGTRLSAAMAAFSPDIVLHLAAQPLVLAGYRSPAETFEVNAIGTARLLDAVLRTDSVRAVVVVTSDKCYDNPEAPRGLTEEDPLGGADPYSASKACAELVTAAYRRSFFGPGRGHPASVATARAGNVIGGGDFAEGRLAPDAVRAWRAGREPQLRLPGAIRPWQHVLEPLAGYLRLAEALWAGGDAFAGPWNFGPSAADCRTAGWLAAALTAALRGEAAAAAEAEALAEPAPAPSSAQSPLQPSSAQSPSSSGQPPASSTQPSTLSSQPPTPQPTSSPHPLPPSSAQPSSPHSPSPQPPTPSSPQAPPRRTAPAEGGERALEALSLRLDSSKAEARLDWRPRWTALEAVRKTADWYRAWANEEELLSFSLGQLAKYASAPAETPGRSV
ncbi:CDP-glucose 4,6-dehydratase [Cohnella sp. AR92]|nr:CDP-glucose 4,6-dehydratase [Cohnella sp. AR92]